MVSFILAMAFLFVGLAGVAVHNLAVLGMAKEMKTALPTQAEDFRWYRVLGKRAGGSGPGVSALYFERYGKDGKYAKLARGGWRLFTAGFVLAILSSIFAVLR